MIVHGDSDDRWRRLDLLDLCLGRNFRLLGCRFFESIDTGTLTRIGSSLLQPFAIIRLGICIKAFEGFPAYRSACFS
jgi:hypothetical protein